MQENTEIRSQLRNSQQELNEVKIRLADTQINQSNTYSKISTLTAELQQERMKNTQKSKDSLDAGQIAVSFFYIIFQLIFNRYHHI